MTRKNIYTIGFVAACVGYVLVNYLSLKSRYIPGEGHLFAWGFVIPLIMAQAGSVLSVAILQTNKSKVCGSLAAGAFFLLLGLFNVILIKGIWATI